MNDKPLFFHIRNQDILDHTYCIKEKNKELLIGYSIVHENDAFCRRLGRELSEKKTKILETIEDKNFKNGYEYEIPQSVGDTLPLVIQRAGEIKKLQGQVKVKIFANRHKKRIPLILEYNILPKII